MVKVTAKLQNVNECLLGWDLQNCCAVIHQTWYCDASSWATMSCKKVKVSAKLDFLLSFLNYRPFCNQTLVWFACTSSWAGLSCGKIAKLKKLIEFWLYLLNCCRCNQTWYDDASCTVPCKKLGLLSLRSRPLSTQSNMTFYHICSTSLLFWQPYLIGKYIVYIVLCKKIGSLCSRSRSQWRFKTSLDLCLSYSFCTTDLLATKKNCFEFLSLSFCQVWQPGLTLIIQFFMQVKK